MKVVLEVNGERREVEAPGLRRLLDVIREDIGLTGTKEGCGEGECGACSVILDGEVVCSCLVPAVQVAGATVRTVEGIGRDDALDAVQAAFLKHGAAQCGICTPGFIVTARALLDAEPGASRERIREALAGNLCRCTGYQAIIDAVETAGGGAC